MARWVLALLVAAGCGPVAYVNQVTFRASDAVAAAKAAEAETYAPYFWTRATQYLRMARVQAARADFQGAVHFGELATEAGQRAVTEAALAKKDPSRMPLDAIGGAGSAAPAKEPSEDAEVPAELAPAKPTKPAAPRKPTLAPAKDAP